MDLGKFAPDDLSYTVKNLGNRGTISYLLAIVIFIVALQVDFQTELTKAVILSIIGVSLLLSSVIIYVTESKQVTLRVVEALGVLSEIYNRMAEQIEKSDKEKTISITTTIDNLPDRITEVIRNAIKANR